MSEISKRCCGECRCETPEDTRKCPVKIYAELVRDDTPMTYEFWDRQFLAPATDPRGCV